MLPFYMVACTEPRGLAQHPGRPLASFIGLNPTCPEQASSLDATFTKSGGAPQLSAVDCHLLLALHSSDGNSAAAFTLDGKTGPHDPHRCRKHRSGIFSESSRQQGILTQHPAGVRPRSRRIL